MYSWTLYLNYLSRKKGIMYTTIIFWILSLLILTIPLFYIDIEYHTSLTTILESTNQFKKLIGIKGIKYFPEKPTTSIILKANISNFDFTINRNSLSHVLLQSFDYSLRKWIYNKTTSNTLKANDINLTYYSYYSYLYDNLPYSTALETLNQFGNESIILITYHTLNKKQVEEIQSSIPSIVKYLLIKHNLTGKFKVFIINNYQLAHEIKNKLKSYVLYVLIVLMSITLIGISIILKSIRYLILFIMTFMTLVLANVSFFYLWNDKVIPLLLLIFILILSLHVSISIVVILVTNYRRFATNLYFQFEVNYGFLISETVKSSLKVFSLWLLWFLALSICMAVIADCTFTSLPLISAIVSILGLITGGVLLPAMLSVSPYFWISGTLCIDYNYFSQIPPNSEFILKQLIEPENGMITKKVYESIVYDKFLNQDVGELTSNNNQWNILWYKLDGLRKCVKGYLYKTNKRRNICNCIQFLSAFLLFFPLIFYIRIDGINYNNSELQLLPKNSKYAEELNQYIQNFPQYYNKPIYWFIELKDLMNPLYQKNKKEDSVAFIAAIHKIISTFIHKLPIIKSQYILNPYYLGALVLNNKTPTISFKTLSSCFHTSYFNKKNFICNYLSYIKSINSLFHTNKNQSLIRITMPFEVNCATFNFIQNFIRFQYSLNQYKEGIKKYNITSGNHVKSFIEGESITVYQVINITNRSLLQLSAIFVVLSLCFLTVSLRRLWIASIFLLELISSITVSFSLLNLLYGLKIGYVTEGLYLFTPYICILLISALYICNLSLTICRIMHYIQRYSNRSIALSYAKHEVNFITKRLCLSYFIINLILLFTGIPLIVHTASGMLFFTFIFMTYFRYLITYPLLNLVYQVNIHNI